MNRYLSIFLLCLSLTAQARGRDSLAVNRPSDGWFVGAGAGIQGFLDINIYNITVLETDNSVADALCEKLNSVITHSACFNSVAECGRAASLDMTEYCSTALDMYSLFDLFGDLGQIVFCLGFLFFTFLRFIVFQSLHEKFQAEPESWGRSVWAGDRGRWWLTDG